MTVFRHELRQGRVALAIWIASLAGLLAVCIGIFPEMRGQMEGVSALFASMGRFTAAFGMDRLDMGSLTGFYAVECGSVMALGGAFYACLSGVSALAREERDGTAELLLTQPVSRPRIVSEKLAAVLAQLAVMNAALLCLALAAIRCIGERIPWREVLLLHGACWLLQMELACVCFGLSAFLRRGGAGAAMGLAAGTYLLELIANLTDRAGFLRYLTPFAYCEGADIVAAGHLDTGLAALGLAWALAGVAAAYGWYGRKDIR